MIEEIKDTIRKAVKERGDLFEHLDRRAYWLIVVDELREWRSAEVKRMTDGGGEGFEVKYTPESIRAMVDFVKEYADCPDCLSRGFEDVIAFIKAEDGKEKYNRIPTPSVEFSYEANSQITQEDIDEAVERWDELMPEYKGLLDARVEEEENA